MWVLCSHQYLQCIEELWLGDHVATDVHLVHTAERYHVHPRHICLTHLPKEEHF